MADKEFQATVLIVDDEPFNVDYLEQELEDLGYITVPASNGEEALARVADSAPDVILLDIMMPIMDGFTVLEHLKASNTWRHIPVIVISANDDLDSTVRGIEMGAEDYLPKPFEADPAGSASEQQPGEEAAARYRTTLSEVPSA